MVGAVLSTLTVAGSFAVLPALSVAVPMTTWSSPSVVTVLGPVQLAMPDRVAWSSHSKVTVTLVLFQPSKLATGSRLCVIVGLLLSILTVTVLTSSMLPALSTDQYVTVWVP